MNEVRWSVEVVVDEHQNRTRAVAMLNAADKPTLTGTGLAKRDPKDCDVPAIGDELAVARALADLAHQLIEATIEDIETATQRPAHLTG
ncbi:DUF1876 domain-containing protein [Rhodococcus sp. NPDC059234]|uniref:DUF1876 domain-containing protein n=1 Tax=Rhodococcus sp. NPDC059234 TaxID=3346781 RepID=UPI00366ED8D6